MSRDYALNRIAKCGYDVTILGKDILAERIGERYFGRLSKVYNEIFRNNKDRLLRRLEHELSIKNEYIKGLEELLYEKIITEESNNNQQ